MSVIIRVNSPKTSSALFRQIRFKTNSAANDDYQYLQRSQVPMLHFQPSLPRLPIPQLEKTCERYLASIRPLLNDEEFKNSEKMVKDFETSSGPELQKLLQQKDAANKHTSYISEPWFDMYLKDRVPLPINYNPLLMMKYDERKDYNNQLIRISNIVVSSLRFMKSLRKNYLAPEVFHLNPSKSDTPFFKNFIKMIPSSISTYVAYAFKAYPLDMSQYMGLFGATRIPELDKDRIYRNDSSKHIVVMKNGHFYTVDVLDKLGNIEDPTILLGRLKHIINDDKAPNEHPLGVLTTENRNIWATLRNELIESGNEKQMEQIDSALFCVCLDENTYKSDDPIPMVKNFLYGDGTNRWFDKSLSVIISKDGTTGINFEHSWGDGVAVLRYFNEIYKETTENPFVHPSTQPAANDANFESSIKQLEFNLNEKIKQGIQDATSHHNSITNSLDVNFLQMNDIGKNLCKQSKLSPDSFMQLGFQLAYYKQHGNFVGTYESCSTAAFRHGRTECMRPCTLATQKLCTEIVKSNNSKAEIRELINQCSKAHGILTREAAMGQGFDRHLFGLRTTAVENQIPKPDIFTDPAYSNINYNIVSTSTLSSNGLLAGGFGPVVKDGYGIAYNIQDNLLGSIVSNYSAHSNGSDFIECLRSAYSDMKKALV